MAAVKFLDLRAQYLGIKREIDAAIETVLSDCAFVGGPHLARFEANFAKFQQAAYCVAVGNGTDSLEIALEALKLPAGGEVIVPANSFIASSEAVTRSGLRVVFADIDAATCNLDLADVERRITPRTAAIMAVHLYGQPCDIVPLVALARRRNLRVIEDCAQAHGAEYQGKRVGTFGDVGSFSFYPGKNLGAYGDGGALVTNDEALAKRCRMIANHGRISKYDHEFEGRNSRLDGLQAAILDVKLQHLDKWVDARNAVAAAYRKGLAGLSRITLLGMLPAVRHAYHLFVIRVPERAALAAHLEADGIQTGIHYPIALPKLIAYSYLGQAHEPMVANKMDAELLSLPIGEHLAAADVARVCESVRRWHG
ncbi:MAG: DegT/DnrJ/EryC1/StrS family aminotransferase [Pseudomonadota bacterium]